LSCLHGHRAPECRRGEARFAVFHRSRGLSEANFALRLCLPLVLTASAAGTTRALVKSKRLGAFVQPHLETVMHDIDRTQLEFESDLDEFESDQYESVQAPPYQNEAPVFSDADEMELAAELLATSDEQELDQFIGKPPESRGAASRSMASIG
jgi:hypothetical protein